MLIYFSIIEDTLSQCHLLKIHVKVLELNHAVLYLKEGTLGPTENDDKVKQEAVSQLL